MFDTLVQLWKDKVIFLFGTLIEVEVEFIWVVFGPSELCV